MTLISIASYPALLECQWLKETSRRPAKARDYEKYECEEMSVCLCACVHVHACATCGHVCVCVLYTHTHKCIWVHLLIHA